MYTPLTGQACGCKRGIERDNCPRCEGTGKAIDFRAIHKARQNQGTRWTEPGMGATVGMLYDAINRAINSPVPAHLVSSAAAYLRDVCWETDEETEELPRFRTTNLALTGQPLTVEDLKRIEQAKVGR